MTTTDSDRSSPPNVWRDREFVKLWIGHTASQFGAQASEVTLPLIAVLALGAGATELGALRAVQQLPVLLFSLLVGAWVDHWRARNVLVLADVGRALVLAAIPIAYAFGLLDRPVLFVVAFLVGVFTVFFDVGYQACLARLVRRDQLTQGNSMLESSASAAQIGGPALGGGLVTLLTAPIANVAGGLFFVVSFLSIQRVRRPETADPQLESPAGVLHRIHEGLRFVVGDPALRTIGIASATYQFFFAAMMTSYLLFLPRTLHLSGAEVGLALAGVGPGTLIGSLLSTTLPRRFGYGVVMVVAAVIADIVLIAAPALHGSGARTVVLLIAINAAFGACAQTVNIADLAVRQAFTPIRMQGRVAATMQVSGMGLTPLGSLVGGVIAGSLGPRAGLLLTAVALLSSPLCLGLSPLRKLGKTLPPPRQL